ncbi:MAG: Rrf2 family transcriptional regulator [Blautia sp.]
MQSGNHTKYLKCLEKDGIIEVKSGTGGATLAVPLSEISLYRICHAVDPAAIEKMISIHGTPSLSARSAEISEPC